jgi:hypothetical protein
MSTQRLHILSCVFIFSALMYTSCRPKIVVKDEDEIFHASPVDCGFGCIFFRLYKGGKYEFCDGDFMNPGCYTGNFALSGDTIIFIDLKRHIGIPTKRFIIRRYQNMDSSYWKWKYPDQQNDWQNMQYRDTSLGFTGDVFPLGEKSEILFDKNKYFAIRRDDLQNNR